MDAIGKVVDGTRSKRDRQSRLSAAAGAGERQEPGGLEQTAGLGELAFPPDEAGPRLRQAAREVHSGMVAR
jgi:hypothetical protein